MNAWSKAGLSSRSQGIGHRYLLNIVAKMEVAIHLAEKVCYDAPRKGAVNPFLQG